MMTAATADRLSDCPDSVGCHRTVVEEALLARGGVITTEIPPGAWLVKVSPAPS